MSRMRVAWLNQWDASNPKAGGAERTVGEVGKRLATQDVELTVFSEIVPGTPPTSEIDGYRVVRPGGPVGVHLWTLSHFSKRRDKVEFDVLVHDLAKIMPWTLPLTSRPVPGILFVHHVFGRELVRELFPPLGAFAAFVERFGPRFYRGVFGVTETEYTKSMMVKAGLPPDRIWVIPPGIDLGLFSPNSMVRSVTPVVAYAGRLKKYKRVDLAVAAVKMLKGEFPELKLEIVGVGSDMPRLRQVVRDMGMQDSVSFVGHISDQALRELYQRSWANVQPSSVEGWGFTTLEAAACGTPTVAFRNSVFPETVGPYCQKYLADDGDVLDLSHKMAICLRDQESRPREVSAHQVDFAREFDWDSTAKNWKTMLSRVAES